MAIKAVLVATATMLAAMPATAQQFDERRGNNGYPGAIQSTRCEARDDRRQYCTLDTSRGVTLVRQFSERRCVEGRSWGADARGVWVSNGCRASFAAGAANGPGAGLPGGGYPGNDYPVSSGGGGRQIVVCESVDRQRTRCRADIDRGVRLVETLSRRDCVEGRTWGYNRRAIWVSEGCRGRFRVF